ncbi:MAG: mannitol dehydrogenase family protein [Clostridiales bacterium]|nr:mannitol dehydrogenase family protein [Clostridiales bacterium]
MKLSLESLDKKVNWIGYRLPTYDIPAMRARTKAEPKWLHFGAGNIFRAFPAMLVQRLMTAGLMDTGIICCEPYDEEIIDRVYRPYDNLAVAVTLHADGFLKKDVVGSIAESLKLSAEYDRVREIFCAPSLQMVTLTVTEKAYNISDAQMNVLPEIAADMKAGPKKAQSFLGRLAALCLDRMHTCNLPLALVSMDNCYNNGHRLQRAIFEIASKWMSAGLIDATEFAYLTGSLSFPRTMIDKITPYPNAQVATVLRQDGLEDTKPVVTQKGSTISYFVNTEQPQYLVIEDKFPNGRPPLDQMGVIFTTGAIVEKCMSMKACTCLNPMDTAMGVYGCLFGYESIAEMMKDEDIVALISGISETESMPLGTDPGVLDPAEFIHEILTVRYPNPFLPDTPQRITTDTSQKVATRYGETLMNYYNSKVPMHKVTRLRFIPLAIAGWLRYLIALDDKGEPITLSPDPAMDLLQESLRGIKLGDPDSVCEEALYAILSDRMIFGCNLYEVGCGETVVDYFRSMLKGPGAVRETLHRVCTDTNIDVMI